MAKVENFEVGTVDEETVWPMHDAAHIVAGVLLQMLIDAKGDGPWVDEVHENFRRGVDREGPPEGWPGDPGRWREAQLAEFRMIFAHRHMVGSVKPKN